MSSNNNVYFQVVNCMAGTGTHFGMLTVENYGDTF